MLYNKKESFEEISRRAKIFKTLIPSINYELNEGYSNYSTSIGIRPLKIDGAENNDILIKYKEIIVGSAFNSNDISGMYNQKPMLGKSIKKYVLDVVGENPETCRVVYTTLQPGTIDRHKINNEIIESICTDSSIQVDLEMSSGSAVLVITPYNSSGRSDSVMDFKTKQLSNMEPLKSFKSAIEDTHANTMHYNEKVLPKVLSRL
jgi:hypothetical protein